MKIPLGKFVCYNSVHSKPAEYVTSPMVVGGIYSIRIHRDQIYSEDKPTLYEVFSGDDYITSFFGSIDTNFRTLEEVRNNKLDSLLNI